MQSIPDRRVHADMLQLSMCTLVGEDGSPIAIRSLWEKQTAIFIFLRHFACEACRLHAMDVWEKRELYQSKGAKLHFVGNGSVHFIKTFKADYGLKDASFFTDPTLRAFRAAGFKKGFWISPGEMHSRPEFLTLAIRHALKRTGSGNVWQLGGVLAVKPGGHPVYQFTSLSVGDFPPSSDVPQIAGAD